MSGEAPTIPATPKVESALALARQHPQEFAHLEQVTRLAAVLFRELEPLHGMGDDACELLCCAALLHDIGISISYARHHKHSLRLILEAALPGFSPVEHQMVANVARYHRKARPKSKHKAFAPLSAQQRDVVRRLAAILRMADGLDRDHEDAVEQLKATATSPVHWLVELWGHGDLAYATWGAERKADLFESLFGVAIRFEPKGAPK